MLTLRLWQGRLADGQFQDANRINQASTTSLQSTSIGIEVFFLSFFSLSFLKALGRIWMHSRIIFTWKLTSNRQKQHSSALTRRSIIVKLKAKKMKIKKPMEIFAPESVSVCSHPRHTWLQTCLKHWNIFSFLQTMLLLPYRRCMLVRVVINVYIIKNRQNSGYN